MLAPRHFCGTYARQMWQKVPQAGSVPSGGSVSPRIGVEVQMKSETETEVWVAL